MLLWLDPAVTRAYPGTSSQGVLLRVTTESDGPWFTPLRYVRPRDPARWVLRNSSL